MTTKGPMKLMNTMLCELTHRQGGHIMHHPKWDNFEWKEALVSISWNNSIKWNCSRQRCCRITPLKDVRVEALEGILNRSCSSVLLCNRYINKPREIDAFSVPRLLHSGRAMWQARVRTLLLSLFYQKGNWGMERLKSLSKVTRLASGRCRIQILTVWLCG